MNKHVVNVLDKYNFTYENNNAYGKIEGYEVNVFNDPLAIGPVFYFSTFLSQSKKNDFVLKLNSYKLSLIKVVPFDFGVAVTIGSMTAGTFEKKFDGVLSKILEALAFVEAPKSDICPQSGESIDDLNSKLTVVPYLNVKIRLSNSALDAVNSIIDNENAAFAALPNNYLKGFGGILLGALVGVAMTVVFSLIGFITALSPLVSIYLGVFLYKKLGGKPDAVMVVMSLVTTVVTIMGTLLILYVLATTGICAEAGLSYMGFEALSYCLEKSSELRMAFIYDMVLNVLFIIIAEAASIFSLIRMIKRPKNIK